MLSTGFATLREKATVLLEQWANAVDEHFYPAQDNPAIGVYGPGYSTWGVQSNLNYAGAMATLANQETARDKSKWCARAVAALRFALATHLTGRRPGNDGQPWGNSWISMLGIERAMHGLQHLDQYLTVDDRTAMRRVLVSEADWLLLHVARGKHTGVVAGLWGHGDRNNPESNIWSGCLLWRVAELYPEEPNAPAWRERAHDFLINGISLATDAADMTIVAGRPIADRHAGANFFPRYALDHHGYLNVGYMAICVSNVAILHFDMKDSGRPRPESLYHHVDGLWQVLRRMIFRDGRLARIGGDSRVRYTYCQEYLLPSLLLAADYLQDGHALELAERQLELIEQEATASGNGAFYGRRMQPMRLANPHYYTRLESDRACVLAMLLNYLPLVNVPAPSPVEFEESVAGAWTEPDHGAVMHRSEQRLCSFAWRAHGLAQALCLPPGDSDLAEWSLNLSPVVRFLGDDGRRPEQYRRLLTYHIEPFAGGFVTSGSIMEGVGVNIDEGAACTDQAVTQIAFAALPDGKTCLGLQYVQAATDRVGYMVELKDLHLVVPNDLFNGFHRTLQAPCGQTVLTSPPARTETLRFQGRWLNIDDRLGLVILSGGDEILADRSVSRRAGRYSSLYVEEFCLHVRQGTAWRCQPGETLIDIGFAVLSGITADSTRRVRGDSMVFAQENIRGVWVEEANEQYALVANFGADMQTVEVFGESMHLKAGAAKLLQTNPSTEIMTAKPASAADGC